MQTWVQGYDCPGPSRKLKPQERICEVRKALLRANLPFGGKASQPMSLDEYCFKHEPADYNVYWDVRKGLIPIVGAARETGAPGRLSGL